MSSRNIRVAVVTPVHNRRDITLQCLKSLSRINSDGIEIRTFVVDDGSTDGTGEAIAAAFPDVSVIQGRLGTFFLPKGTNVGVRAALAEEPDYVLMMNDDQVFDPDFLRYLVETAAAVSAFGRRPAPASLGHAAQAFPNLPAMVDAVGRMAPLAKADRLDRAEGPVGG
jgi:GT2 family glycosyltransferase